MTITTKTSSTGIARDAAPAATKSAPYLVCHLARLAVVLIGSRINACIVSFVILGVLLLGGCHNLENCVQALNKNRTKTFLTKNEKLNTQSETNLTSRTI
jgi:hypothetical protein